MIFLPDAEDRTIVSSFVWTKHRNVTDGQSDRQNRFGFYSCRHCQQCGRAVKMQGVKMKDEITRGIHEDDRQSATSSPAAQNCTSPAPPPAARCASFPPPPPNVVALVQWDHSRFCFICVDRVIDMATGCSVCRADIHMMRQQAVQNGTTRLSAWANM